MSFASKAFSILQRDVLLFGTNLLTGVVVARALGPQALGLWVVLQLVPSYAEAVARLKFDAAAVFVLGKGTYAKQDVLFNVNVLAAATSVLVLAAVLLQVESLAGILFNESAREATPLLVCLLPQIPLQFFYLNYTYYHLAAEDVRTYNRMVLIRALSNSILAVGLLAIHLRLWAVVVAAVVSTAAGLAYGWARVDRTAFQVRGRLNRPLLRDLLRYGWHMYVAGVLSHLNMYGTRAIVVFFLLPAQVAFFGLAQGVGQLMDRIPQALGTILFPRVSRIEMRESVPLAANAFRITFMLLLAAAALVAAAAEVLITLLYGRDFAPAAWPLRIMLLGIVVAGAGSVLGQYFQGVGRADLLPKLQLGPMILQMILAVIMVKSWGLSGAALALAIGLVTTGLVQTIAFVRIASTSIRDLIPGPRDVRQVFDLLAHSIPSLAGRRA